MKKYLPALIVLLLALHADTTTADVTVFSTVADYNAATGPEIFFIDFNPSPQPGQYVDGSSFSPDVTFGSPEASDPNLVLWSSNSITDAGSNIADNGVGPVDGNFTSPVYAFALVFSSASEAETVSLFDPNGDPIDSVTAPNPSGFFGVLSDTPIKTFLIDNGMFDPNNADRFFVDDFRANEPPIPVHIDIKPGSCPNPLNLKSRGVLPVAILGTEIFDVADIDIATIRLAGVAPVRSAVEDVATPVDGNECECNEDGPDGLTDLTLKFKTQEIVDALVFALGQKEYGLKNAEPDILVLTLTGELLDGTPIEGSDCVVLVGKIPEVFFASKADINEDGAVDFADLTLLKKYFWSKDLNQD